ncbi:unnamed protein product, partial [Allacma fusca]
MRAKKIQRYLLGKIFLVTQVFGQTFLVVGQNIFATQVVDQQFLIPIQDHLNFEVIQTP